VSARLTHAISSPPGRRQLLRAHLDAAEGTVSPVGGPGSHLVGGLADADALVVVPEDVTALEAGASVSVLPMDSGLEGGH
jgi:molybdopterin molybdotransferase